MHVKTDAWRGRRFNRWYWKRRTHPWVDELAEALRIHLDCLEAGHPSPFTSWREVRRYVTTGKV